MAEWVIKLLKHTFFLLYEKVKCRFKFPKLLSMKTFITAQSTINETENDGNLKYYDDIIDTFEKEICTSSNEYNSLHQLCNHHNIDLETYQKAHNLAVVVLF